MLSAAERAYRAKDKPSFSNAEVILGQVLTSGQAQSVGLQNLTVNVPQGGPRRMLAAFKGYKAFP